jgi:hypothetical protein
MKKFKIIVIVLAILALVLSVEKYKRDYLEDFEDLEN